MALVLHLFTTKTDKLQKVLRNDALRRIERPRHGYLIEGWIFTTAIKGKEFSKRSRQKLFRLFSPCCIYVALWWETWIALYIVSTFSVTRKIDLIKAFGDELWKGPPQRNQSKRLFSHLMFVYVLVSRQLSPKGCKNAFNPIKIYARILLSLCAYNSLWI